MHFQKGEGAGGLIGSQRFGNLRVLARAAFGNGGIVEERCGVSPGERFDPPRDFNQALVSAGFDKGGVPGAVVFERGNGVGSRGGTRSGLLEILAEILRGSCSQKNGKLFETPEDRVNLLCFLAAQGGQIKAPIRVACQEPFGFQLNEGLADGCTADAEFGGESGIVEAGVLVPAAVQKHAEDEGVGLAAKGEPGDGG